MEKNIWLFGAGKWGEKYIEEYGDSLCKGFVDNSPKRQETKIKDVPVYGYNKFKMSFDKEKDIIYITTSKGRDEILMQLFGDKLHTFAKVYNPNRGGIVDIENSWDKVTNSQLGEDIGLKHWFECNGMIEGYKGFYLDIGAYHPFAYNNTRWAYDLGWRGMNIDPNERSIELFNIFRPDDINVNCGASDKNEELTYYIRKGAEGMNSFVDDDRNAASATSTKVIKVRNINDILEEHNIEKIDFVDIDVEGFDERIVHIFNWKKYQPKCVLIELLGQGDIEAVLQTSIHKKMKEEGYVLKSFYTVTALYIKNMV